LVQELRNAFDKLKPTKATQANFSRLWDNLELQGFDPADKSNVKPAVKAQSSPHYLLYRIELPPGCQNQNLPRAI
jgi:hypothetical protein